MICTSVGNPSDHQSLGEHIDPNHQSVPTPAGLVVLAVWLGILGGLSELAAFLLIRARSGEVSPYIGKVREYPWMMPLVDTVLLVTVSIPLAVLIAFRPHLGRRLGPFLLVSCAVMPTLLVLTPGLYAGALFLLAMGVASIVTPIVRRRSIAAARVVRWTLLPLILGLVAVAVWRSNPGRPSVAETAVQGPNVLLVVLDTVRADRLSLDGTGAPRRTSPELEALAARGVTFTGAHATAPWTLPSHASLMTGRWAFEVCVGRFGAMSDDCPTLAGSLASLGYDTVGIAANTFYATYSTGLARDFSQYEDLPISPSTMLTSTEVGSRLVDRIGTIAARLWPGEPPPLQRFERIDAGSVNRRFLRWLDGDRDRNRPFFAFLNYFDAHDPYVVPAGETPRFGTSSLSLEDRSFLESWWQRPEKTSLAPHQLDLLIDGYDSCIASLDAQLGRLFRELDRRGLMEDLVVVITSDHGEAFGEHDLFGHGVSLFEDQLHVPLVVVAPGLVPEGRSIDRVVTLRDVPATVLDLVGHPAPTLPGASLAPLWRDTDPAGAPGETPNTVSPPSPAVASVSGPDSFPPNEGRSPVFGGPMISIMDERSLKYIRTGGLLPTREELYAVRGDPGEEFDLASPAALPILERFRSALGELGDSLGSK